jgi:mono/diheme cytochrome c family protein
MLHQTRFIKRTGLAALALSLIGCAWAAEPNLEKLPPPSAKKGLTYAKDVRPIFEAACIKCHGENRPKAGVRLDDLEALLKGGKEGKVIVPGKSEKSPLLIAVAQIDENLAMPPKPMGKPLTAEQVGLIRAWIDQGAK